MKKKLLFSLITAILFLQFLPIRPPEGTNRNEIQTSDEVKKILRKSCYDCHSDLTEWPWYSKIFPVNVYLYNHVKEGKVELNFSEWNSLSKKEKSTKGDSILETLEEKEMPPGNYILLHPSAKVTREELQVLKNWVRDLEEEYRKE
ncbi:heme-binding domain protein [Leptospira weilii str. 2006001853]|uniref:Heme-binding domain protein n=1 Tax=Leptospira weilii str. 2006001853 TaxID=1001589 RepID=A0A828Z0K1_9LEPT|nr:heme-binding domain-containing protein [Leptospira weilii]EKR63849.1 heme-binding domain protein [Leptospira weilii str. 2006001853]EMN43232.1 heme-binding domain protein [Leptospira weilii str. LNT 1234]QDK23560.1 heme-binding protein [Leptospira weilii]QDK26800.1 heme-binding protein [Leptospira weilii]